MWQVFLNSQPNIQRSFDFPRTMAVVHSQNVLLEDIYVNNLEDSGSGTHNTDGANTIFSKQITFNRWEVLNGDDSISIKANSTDIKITNSIFRTGLGLAFGSIGQLLGQLGMSEN
jgi:galacturan 1,4-alpha-galacturonidase